jgi:hypothetical protein
MEKKFNGFKTIQIIYKDKILSEILVDQDKDKETARLREEIVRLRAEGLLPEYDYENLFLHFTY